MKTALHIIGTGLKIYLFADLLLWAYIGIGQYTKMYVKSVDEDHVSAAKAACDSVVDVFDDSTEGFINLFRTRQEDS